MAQVQAGLETMRCSLAEVPERLASLAAVFAKATGQTGPRGECPVTFIEARLVRDPPKGLGYADLAARIRRDITSKRAILRMITCDVNGDLRKEAFARGCDCEHCRILLAIASAWSDHPGYAALAAA